MDWELVLNLIAAVSLLVAGIGVSMARHSQKKLAQAHELLQESNRTQSEMHGELRESAKMQGSMHRDLQDSNADRNVLQITNNRLLTELRSAGMRKFKWSNVGQALDDLATRVAEDYQLHGIVGIHGGGLAFADMLGVRLLGHLNRSVPVRGVGVSKRYWPKRYRLEDTEPDLLREFVESRRILLVEDFFIGGDGLQRCAEMIETLSPAELRILVVQIPQRCVDNEFRVGERRIDFHYAAFPSTDFEMPWGRTPPRDP